MLKKRHRILNTMASTSRLTEVFSQEGVAPEGI